LFAVACTIQLIKFELSSLLNSQIYQNEDDQQNEFELLQRKFSQKLHYLNILIFVSSIMCTEGTELCFTESLRDIRMALEARQLARRQAREEEMRQLQEAREAAARQFQEYIKLDEYRSVRKQMLDSAVALMEYRNLREARNDLANPTSSVEDMHAQLVRDYGKRIHLQSKVFQTVFVNNSR